MKRLFALSALATLTMASTCNYPGPLATLAVAPPAGTGTFVVDLELVLEPPHERYVELNGYEPLSAQHELYLSAIAPSGDAQIVCDGSGDASLSCPWTERCTTHCSASLQVDEVLDAYAYTVVEARSQYPEYYARHKDAVRFKATEWHR